MGFNKFYTLGQERLVITLSDDVDFDDILVEEQVKNLGIQCRLYEKKIEKLKKLQSKDKLTRKEKIELEDLQKLTNPIDEVSIRG